MMNKKYLLLLLIISCIALGSTSCKVNKKCMCPRGFHSEVTKKLDRV